MNQRALLTVGGVGLKRGRIVNSQKAMISLATEINAYLRESKFLTAAPFSVISLIFRYGEEFGAPEIQPIDRKNGELPVAVEIPMDELRTATIEEVKQALASVLIPVLKKVADLYKLPLNGISRFCSEYGYEFDNEGDPPNSGNHPQ